MSDNRAATAIPTVPVSIGPFSTRTLFLENVWRILPAAGTVVDFGAGRGAYSEHPTLRRLNDFRGKDRRVIGLDVDSAVRENPMVDQAIVWDGVSVFPLADASVDVIVSLSVFEHVEHAEFVASELTRVLKPGGWLCAETPNRWGYIAVLATLVPNFLHKPILRFFMPSRKEQDTFPTRYRMNTLSRISFLYPTLEQYSYTYSGPSGYTRGIKVLAAFLRFWEHAVAGTNLHIFLRKSSVSS